MIRIVGVQIQNFIIVPDELAINSYAARHQIRTWDPKLWLLGFPENVSACAIIATAEVPTQRQIP